MGDMSMWTEYGGLRVTVGLFDIWDRVKRKGEMKMCTGYSVCIHRSTYGVLYCELKY